MRILLAMPKINSEESPHYSITMGILYVSSYLKKYGDFEIKTLNLNHFHQDEIPEILRKHLPFDYFFTGGVSAFFPQIENLCQQVRAISPGTRIVLGGAIATAHPEFALQELKPYALILGEGEETALQFLRAERDSIALDEVSGLAFERNGIFVKTPRRPLIEDLDSLPWPDWEGFDFGYYLDNYGVFSCRMGYVVGSRGCTHACSYCFRLMGNHSYRMRSSESVIKEVLELQKRFKIEQCGFYDELISIDKDRLKRIAHGCKERAIPWVCAGIRTDGVDDELFKFMKDTDVVYLGYGLESLNRDVLRAMHKGATPEQIEAALLGARKFNVKTIGKFIFGSAAETLETARETLERRRKLRGICSEMGWVVPYPGTELYWQLIKKGKIRDFRYFHEETLHTMRGEDGRLINMTAMSDDDLKELQNLWLTDLVTVNPYGKVLVCDYRETCRANLRAQCPICDKEVVLTDYCVDQKYFRVECSECTHYFFLPRMDFPHIKKANSEYREKLKQLREEKCELIITPLIRKPAFDAMYKSDFSDLPILAIMDKDQDLAGKSYNGYSVLHRNVENVKKFSDKYWIILRDILFNENSILAIKKELLELGIPEEKILLARGEPVQDTRELPEEQKVSLFK